jgi:hypothetical protein
MTMILRRMAPTDPLCERCLKLTRVTLAVVAFELVDDEQYSHGAVSLCQQCADIVEEDGGEIRGCNESGYPLDPMHPAYRDSK